MFLLGFVTFSSPEQQKKALEAFDGKELDGRTLTVKVAHKVRSNKEKKIIVCSRICQCVFVELFLIFDVFGFDLFCLCFCLG